MENILEIKGLERVYKERFSTQVTRALQGINLNVAAGEFLVIMGESGSGKSTLLNLIATLDRPTAGEIKYKGALLNRLSNADLAEFRRREMGFVFQDFNLLEQFNIADNIRLPMVLDGIPGDEMERRLSHYANILKIHKQLNKYPYELSGGEQQRVAVARALVMKPSIVLADEPTGALDSKTSTHLMESFAELNAAGQTILMVTHSLRAACYGRRILFLRDGRIYYELYRGKLAPEDFREKISDAMALLDAGEARNETA
ncbi:MAG: ABC transporter ATP-binding protein [Eubacteriales bacterium]|nr:ABC transporter ATP-binding protein [Eubacteriales bacterium]